MKSKKIIAVLLAVVLSLQVVSIVPTMVTAENSNNTVKGILNNEGLWLTEVYVNDSNRLVGRSADQYYETIDLFKTSTGATLSEHSAELMEFIEIASTYDSDVSLDQYEIWYNNSTTSYKLNIIDADNTTIKKGQCFVIWNYRSDLQMVDATDESNELSEAHFRKAFNLSEDVVVLKAITGTGVTWSNDSSTNGVFSTFTIKKDGNTLSTFTAKEGATEGDGYSVELKVPDTESEMEVYRGFSIPTPGSIDINAGHYDSVTKTYSKSQLNGLIPGKNYTGNPSDVYVTEIKAYDGSKDVTNYLEIYNATNKTIDLNSDYIIKYCYRESFCERLNIYTTPADANNKAEVGTACTIAPYSLAVLVCCKNKAEPLMPENVPANVPLYYFNINSPDGQLSDGKRGIEIYQATTEGETLVSSFSYLSGDSYSNADCSVHLKPNHDRPNMLWVSGKDTYPGTFKSDQITFDDDGSSLKLTATNGVPSTIIQGEELRVLFNTAPEYINGKKSTLKRTRTELFYRLGTKDESNNITWGNWTQEIEAHFGTPYIRVPEYYEAIITGDKLYDVDSVQFYVKAYNKYRTTLTDIYQVDIKKLDDFSDGIRTNITQGEHIKGEKAFTLNDGTGNYSDLLLQIADKNGTVKKSYQSSEFTPMLDNGAYLTFNISNRLRTGKHALTDTNDNVIKNLSFWYDLVPDGQAIKIDSSYFSYDSTNNKFTTTLRFYAGTPVTYIKTDFDGNEYYSNIDWYTLWNLSLRVNDNSATLDSIKNKDGIALVKNINNLGETVNSYNIGRANTTYSYDDDGNKKTNSDGTYVLTQAQNSKYARVDTTFSVSADSTTAKGVNINTEEFGDGEYTLNICDTSGNVKKSVDFVVDNTNPAISTGINNNSTIKGHVTINPTTDNSDTTSKVVYLDGKVISTPYSTKTEGLLKKGAHTLKVIATDNAGNSSEENINFTVDYNATPNENGTQTVTNGKATLTLSGIQSGETATFYKAKKVNNVKSETISDTEYSYLKYTVNVGTEVSNNDQIFIDWSGTIANPADTKATKMYVYNTNPKIKNEENKWDLVASDNSESSSDTGSSIQNASFIAKNHINKNGEAIIIVQYLKKSASPNLASATNQTNSNSNWDGFSKPENYDFAFAWQTDPQYYAEQYPDIYYGMNQWIVDNAEDWKIKYVINTGDIIDDMDMTYQWKIADKAMKIFDNAGMPYGVLGGNHDVGETYNDSNAYCKYFGEDRFSSQPTYGESYKNNLGHYDLISQNGQDLIIVYMSWNMYTEEINWINKVLEKYSDRKAILCFHTYVIPKNTRTQDSTKTDDQKYLDYFGQRIEEKVVAKNENVFAVLNGHYYGSAYYAKNYTNADNTTRTVYHICKDYQEGVNKGDGYIDMLYFDMANNKLYMNSYWTMAPKAIQNTPGAFNYFDSTLAKKAITSSTYTSTNKTISEETYKQQLANPDRVAEYPSDMGTASTLFDEYINACIIDLPGFFSKSTASEITGANLTAYVHFTNSLGNKTISDNTVSHDIDSLESGTQYYWYAVINNTDTNDTRTDVYTFTTPTPADSEETIWGDANNDGTVTIRDVTAIQLHLVGKKTLSTTACNRCEVNNDGVLSISDATLIQMRLANFITKYPVE